MRISFLKISPSAFRDALIIVDVDGTLVPDSGEVLSEDARTMLRALQSEGKVYLCSNALPHRTAAFAREAGVMHLASSHKKPSRRVIESVAELPERIVVIGDKALTDGLFAANIGAEFIMVERIRGTGESLKGRIGYAADALVSPLLTLFSSFVPYLMLMRPTQWVKNLLVFSPLFFAGAAFSFPLLGSAAIAFISFSLAASAMYILNDYRDREGDALHPTKRFRPLASGAVGDSEGLLLAIVLGFLSIAIGSTIPAILLPLFVYVTLNTAYSFVLKQIPVVDVGSVSASYVLRVLAGGAATGIFVSPWLMSCVFFGALILITGKRRAEFSRESRRVVLRRYTKPMLDALLLGAAVLAIASYSLYAAHTGHGVLIAVSAILVALAIIRLVMRVFKSEDAEYPEVLALKDPVIVTASFVWAAVMIVAFYGN